MNKNKWKLLALVLVYVLVASTVVVALPDIMSIFTDNAVVIDGVHILGYIAYLVGCAFLGWHTGGEWSK